MFIWPSFDLLILLFTDSHVIHCLSYRLNVNPECSVSCNHRQSVSSLQQYARLDLNHKLIHTVVSNMTNIVPNPRQRRYKTWSRFMIDFAMRLQRHDDVIKWKYFPRYWPFVWGIHRSPVNSPHKGQWCGALMFSLICGWINNWVNNLEASDLRRHRTHYAVIVIVIQEWHF